MAERGRALKGLMRKGGAFGQKALSFPFLFPAEQGRRSQGAGGPGHGGGPGQGKRKAGPWEVESPP